MHLAGEADALHGSPIGRPRRPQPRDGGEHGLPPVLRVLLAPAGLRAGDLQRRGGIGEDAEAIAVTDFARPLNTGTMAEAVGRRSPGERVGITGGER
jgi:hypothetical protein